MNVTEELILPRRAAQQPTPAINKGGDCAACVVAGLLGVTLQFVYEKLYEEPASPSRLEMLQVLNRARALSLINRFVDATPMWLVPDYYQAFGAPAYLQSLEWFAYARMALEAGYYGVASVAFNKRGDEGQCPPPTDHAVLICGAREVKIDLPGGSRIAQEILVSCSARTSPDEEWVEVHDFLKNRGGFNALWVKPLDRG